MENKTTFKYQEYHGKNIPQKSKWRWNLARIFWLPSLVIIFVAKTLLRIADIIMFDTHHFSIEITPKK